MVIPADRFASLHEVLKSLDVLGYLLEQLINLVGNDYAEIEKDYLSLVTQVINVAT